MPRLPKKPTKPAKASNRAGNGKTPAPKPALKVVTRTENPRPAPKATKPDSTPASAKPRPTPASSKPKRTIPVHALADERIHLAPAQLGRLRQGYLKTLCSLQAVSGLSPFALADKKQERCRTCFRKVDADGFIGG